MDTKIQKLMFSSKSDVWGTPPEFFNKLDKIYKFTLDPCATFENHKCDKYYTLEDDGLSKSWENEVVFVNPPYSDIGQWVKKAHYEATYNSATVVMLIPARTDTKYWHNYIMSDANKIYFIKGRLKFANPFTSVSNSAPFPSAVVVFHRVKSPFIHYPVIGTMER